IPFGLVSRSGRVYTYRYDGNAIVPLGTRSILARLTDRYGHTASDVILADVEVTDEGDLCPRPAGITCVDFDGDGHFAASSCAGGDDFDDRDPSSAPGFFDRLGDGVDNDNFGGDERIDEDHGVFVDCTGGDDANEGTRAAPLKTLFAAELRPTVI